MVKWKIRCKNCGHTGMKDKEKSTPEFCSKCGKYLWYRRALTNWR